MLPTLQRSLTDRTPQRSNEARDALAQSCLRLAYFLARKASRCVPTIPLEDYQQEAVMQLYEAAQRFQEGFVAHGRIVPFRDYAGRCIWLKLKTLMTTNLRQRLAQFPIDDSGIAMDVGDQAETSGQSAAVEILATIFRELPHDERRLLAAAFGIAGLQRRRTNELAADMGITRRWLWERVRAALRHARVIAERRQLDKDS